MVIGSTDVGPRVANPENYQDNPKRWYSAGVSTTGEVTAFDFEVTEQDVTLNFIGIVESTKNTLKSYLMNTIKPFGIVSITPDAYDDLGVGASGATNFIFVNFSASWIAFNMWNVTISVRKYS